MQPCSYVKFVIDNGRPLHALTAAIADDSYIVTDPATTLWWLREMARPEESKIEARRARSLERGYTPLHQLGNLGSVAVSFPTPGDVAIWNVL